ncbi:oxidoreductase [Capsulimonas corticalis]|uniref:Oxidoreductase n=1 Tax=Capsulimonas corticalis TaxID=2219043 RepID=A0A402CTN7_9BACT|nr:aldo/keto reductase [Capsulimonas corticalis]BDI30670.1 oxidoreductase [Capsulimonas corticalis]
MRKFGRTGWKVSEIGFGGWAIGGDGFGNSYGATDDEVSKAALRRALELGVNLIDTADIYGHGHSEALIGEVLRDWAGTQPIVVTKGGVNFYRRDDTLEQDWTPLAIAHAVQQSLMRLRRETLDLFLLMNPPVEELERMRVWQTLEALQRGGKIAQYGVSVAEPQDGVWLLENDAPVAAIEVAYSLFYQGATTDLLPLARRKKVAVLAREPLANGFLAGAHGANAVFPEGDIRALLPPEYVRAMAETADRLRFLSDGAGRTPAQAALRFVLDDPAVASVVVGAKTPAQVEENIAAVSAPSITEAERRQVLEVFSE